MTDRTTQTDAARADGPALAALLLGAVLVGASPIFVRLSELGPMATAFYRPFLALPVLMIWMTADRRHNPETRKPAGRGDYFRLLLAGAFFSGDLAFWHLSIMNTSVANATLFANFAPIFVTLGAWLLFSHKVTRQYLMGMALALAGAATLAGESFALAPENLLGDFFGLVTAMFLASYILADIAAARRVFHRDHHGLEFGRHRRGTAAGRASGRRGDDRGHLLRLDDPGRAGAAQPRRRPGNDRLCAGPSAAGLFLYRPAAGTGRRRPAGLDHPGGSGNPWQAAGGRDHTVGHRVGAQGKPVMSDHSSIGP